MSNKVVPIENIETIELGEEKNVNNNAKKGYDRFLQSRALVSNKKSVKSISWQNVNFRVGKNAILTSCWGEVQSGKTCAVMGPSGAGKSSLLNVLAGRSGLSLIQM